MTLDKFAKYTNFAQSPTPPTYTHTNRVLSFHASRTGVSQQNGNLDPLIEVVGLADAFALAHAVQKCIRSQLPRRKRGMSAGGEVAVAAAGGGAARCVARRTGRRLQMRSHGRSGPYSRPLLESHSSICCSTSGSVGAVSTDACWMPVSSLQKSVSVVSTVGRTKERNSFTAVSVCRSTRTTRAGSAAHVEQGEHVEARQHVRHSGSRGHRGRSSRR